jgi:uncharacterized protein YceH (UPF0502 family)
VKLPRTPGERESRWAHLLCGEVSVSVSEASAGGAVDDSVSYSEFEILKADHKRLGEELVCLRTMVEHMAAELGITLDRTDGQS